MLKAKRNYKIYDQEMLEIIEALKEWWHFLEGLPEAFEIIMDHWNSEYWRTAQYLSQWQAQWATWLAQLNFILWHKAGKINTQADALSWMPTWGHLIQMTTNLK